MVWLRLGSLFRFDSCVASLDPALNVLAVVCVFYISLPSITLCCAYHDRPSYGVNVIQVLCLSEAGCGSRNFACMASNRGGRTLPEGKLEIMTPGFFVGDHNFIESLGRGCVKFCNDQRGLEVVARGRTNRRQNDGHIGN